MCPIQGWTAMPMPERTVPRRGERACEQALSWSRVGEI